MFDCVSVSVYVSLCMSLFLCLVCVNDRYVYSPVVISYDILKWNNYVAINNIMNVVEQKIK